jgi:hypothetical protein
MRILWLTILLALGCTTANADVYDLQKEVSIPQKNYCAVENFSDRKRALQYITQHGGEIFTDQDSPTTFRVVQCNFNLGDRVVIVSSMMDN